ncbi:MAG: phosphoglycerate mutase, partial [Oscillospiraceae bacterium]|nr:phosphoglycerate mutase [Oscillospiraceae bacterium]
IIDKEILGTILPELNKYDDFKIMILPDHPTPLSLKTHTNDAVPFMIYTKSVKADGKPVFTEKTAAETGLYIEKGPSVMKYFIDLHK